VIPAPSATPRRSPRYSDTISPSRALALVCIIAAIFSRFWILWLEFFFCLFGGAIKTSETFGLAGYYDSHGSNAICFCYGGRDNRDFSTFVQLNWEFCFIWLSLWVVRLPVVIISRIITNSFGFMLILCYFGVVLFLVTFNQIRKMYTTRILNIKYTTSFLRNCQLTSLPLSGVFGIIEYIINLGILLLSTTAKRIALQKLSYLQWKTNQV